MDEKLKELEETSKSIDRIERDGIKSWITSIGYQILMGKYNRLAKELNLEPRQDFRKNSP